MRVRRKDVTDEGAPPPDPISKALERAVVLAVSSFLFASDGGLMSHARHVFPAGFSRWGEKELRGARAPHTASVSHHSSVQSSKYY
jgi:hypothetical protein